MYKEAEWKEGSCEKKKEKEREKEKGYQKMSEKVKNDGGCFSILGFNH